jgi:hypothetical protein
MLVFQNETFSLRRRKVPHRRTEMQVKLGILLCLSIADLALLYQFRFLVCA